MDQSSERSLKPPAELVPPSPSFQRKVCSQQTFGGTNNSKAPKNRPWIEPKIKNHENKTNKQKMKPKKTNTHWKPKTNKKNLEKKQQKNMKTNKTAPRVLALCPGRTSAPAARPPSARRCAVELGASEDQSRPTPGFGLSEGSKKKEGPFLRFFCFLAEDFLFLFGKKYVWRRF